MNKFGQRTLVPIVMIFLGVALIFGSMVWFLNSTQFWVTPTAIPQAGDVPYPDVKRVSLGDAKAAFDLRNAIFIDARGEPYYSQGHIPGALSISIDELPARLMELKKTDWIITYCT